MVKNTDNAEHYTWGQNCDGWHLLKSDTLSVIRERMPPGTSELLHFHDRSQQVFFILDGEALMEVEDMKYTVPAGESIHIPRGTRHKISNTGKTDLHFLVISEPKSHGDRTNC